MFLLDWRLKMSQLYEDTVTPEDHRPCAGLRKELKACLQESECVQVVRVLFSFSKISDVAISNHFNFFYSITNPQENV